MKIFSFVAQSATPSLVPDLPHTKTVLDALFKAGPVMIPLFLLSIFSLMLVVTYLMTIRRGAVVSSGFMATADALLRKRDYLGLLAVSNRHGEAIAEMRKARSLDPLSLIINADLAEILLIAHFYDESVQASRKTIEMDPDFALAHNQPQFFLAVDELAFIYRVEPQQVFEGEIGGAVQEPDGWAKNERREERHALHIRE